MTLISYNGTPPFGEMVTASQDGYDNNSMMGLNPDEECKEFVFIIYVPIFGFICLIGLLGNTLSFVVLQWERKSHVATFLLQSLALADNLFLLTTGIAQIFSAVCLYFNLEAYGVALPAIKVFLWPLVHITQFLTIWLTVLIASSRYIAICRPFQAHKLCTMTKVRIQVAVVVAFSILYNITRFFESKLDEEGSETALKTSEAYQIVYESVLYCIFVFLAPLSILFWLNACLIRELWRARQRLRHMPMVGEEEEQNLTLVMVVIVLTFVVCQTPALINQLLHYCLDVDVAYQCGRPYYYFFHLANLLVCANSATNFFVYCAFRQQFRERLYKLCHKGQALMHSDTYNHNGRTASVYSKTCSKCDAV